MRVAWALILSASAISVAVVGCGEEASHPEDNMRTLPVETISIEGLLVDSWCYAQLKSQGPITGRPVLDEACLTRSLQQGFPLAVFVDTSEVWILSENPRLLREAVSDSVRIQGDVRSDGVLIPRSVSGKIDGAWKAMLDRVEAYDGRGRVNRITEDRQLVIVDHEEIVGYMAAMVMPFAVVDTTLLSGITPGDSVSFEISVTNGDAVLTSLERI